MSVKEKYIDPFTDFGFKWIFGTEEHKDLLISFLNDLLDIESPIVSITYRNLEKLGLNVIDRKAVFDIFCTDENNNNFIVELQRGKQKYFKDRSVYYTSFPIQEQSKKGDWDYSLNKIFFVGILEFELENTPKDKYLSKVQLCDVDSKDIFFDKLTYYYIEMPKFQKSEEELSSHLEYWLYFLNNSTNVTQVPLKLKEDKYISKAFDVAEFLALSPDEQFAYQIDLKARLDYVNVVEYAKECAMEEGREQGLQQGLEQCLEQGLEQGREEGLQQGKYQEKLEIAKISLDQGLDFQTVSMITGLSILEIQKLKD